MFLCDYKTDIGFIRQRVKPALKGINLITRELIPVDEILLNISAWVSIDDFIEVPDRNAFCSFSSRKRRLLMEFDNKVFDVEYPIPFTELDWSAFNSEGVAVETIPEFINDGNLKIQLNHV
ncbi:hypothetical protein VKI22_10495 [Cyanobacterium aponinum UTEX 3221]|uniref:hypothetical protein n=1 Tax=Cyanobacterium aponinum TaxID=379064 RepID=UPI002B4BD71A|nr:hypothetical protein [Cyanobacterium aponinum]WRL37059.1 hypothetical protein VKI22_10495 [Cyanobacterium aponinum UTEX 3221]